MKSYLSRSSKGHTLPALAGSAKLMNTTNGDFEATHFQGAAAIHAQPGGGRKIVLSHAGRDVVDFARCSYLGLDRHPAILAGHANIKSDLEALHGACARTLPDLAGSGELEKLLSNLFDAHVFTFPTMLAANLCALPLIASGLLTNGDVPLMVFDRRAHAALSYHRNSIAAHAHIETLDHNNLADLERMCFDHKLVAYICDGVYSLSGHAPIRELRRLQEKYGLFLYIDDTHSISLCGKTGAGFARSQMEELGDRTIIAASLGKGFGASGGMLMLGTARQARLFGAHAASMPMNAIAIGAALASAKLHRTTELGELQATLKARIALFDRLIPTEHSGMPFPIRSTDLSNALLAIGAADALLQKGLSVSAFFFPTVAGGQAGLRVCLTANHTLDQIRLLCRSINEIRDKILEPE